MTKSTKIMISVICAVVAVCVVVTAAFSIIKTGGNSDNLTTFIDATSVEITDKYIITEPYTIAPSLSDEIIGLWRDSADMSGYRFYEDGSVEVTYVNLTIPVINMPINGSAVGSYTLNGNDLTVSFSIYSKTITKRFTASVENNALKLLNKEDGETATYTKVTEAVTNETTYSQIQNTTENVTSNEQTGIVGTWISGSGDIKYSLNENSTMTVTFSNAVIASISENKISGTYSGVYMTDESNSKIIMQYSVGDTKVTQSFKYTLSNNALSLEGENKETTILVRESASLNSPDASSLIGQWTDSADMSGYKFKEGGIVEITYVNFTVPVVNMPINGTYQGTYSVNGDTLTITSSIYSSTTVNKYTYSVQNNVLTLVSADSGEVSTYRKK